MEQHPMDVLLSDTVDKLMNHTGRTQQQTADGMGMKRAALERRLNGRAHWSAGDMADAAHFFGLTVAEISSGFAGLAEAKRLPPGKREIGQTRI